MIALRSTLAIVLVTASLGCVESGGEQGWRKGGKADGQGGTCAEDAVCLDFKSYDVLFTNPLCELYQYEQPMETADGQGEVSAKPKNVYCTKADLASSAARESSPQFRLLDWIEGTESGDQIFLAYLSFSNQAIADALCDAEERGVDVTFVLDKAGSRSDQLEECGGEVLIRGHQGSVGFAHNKILMINPNEAGPGDDDAQFMRLSFGSGNMSSGTVLHHENWHFLEVARESFFVESHLCLMEALLDPEATNGKGAFRESMNDCRAEIPFDEEQDIWAFFIPALEDSRFASDLVVEGIGAAGSVDIGAHRLGFSDMIGALADRLESDADFDMRLVADDDLYWLRPLEGAGEKVGPNDFFEADNVERLQDAGGQDFQVKYMETNHAAHLLHHNKFIIFRDMPGVPDAVLCGSANLTGTGFGSNLENTYYIDIPHVVDAYKHQFELFWGNVPNAEAPLATSPADMPAADERPLED